MIKFIIIYHTCYSILQISSSKDSTYFWRANPRVGSCTVSADPHIPDKPSNVTISEPGFNRTKGEVRFNLKWLHPADTYGSVEQYEVHVTTEADIDNGDNINTGQIQMVSVSYV